MSLITGTACNPGTKNVIDKYFWVTGFLGEIIALPRLSSRPQPWSPCGVYIHGWGSVGVRLSAADGRYVGPYIGTLKANMMDEAKGGADRSKRVKGGRGK